jgi:hypothetical protein
MGTAAAIGWTPQTFWKATMTEFFAAVEGWNRANGGAPDDAPMTSGEYEEILAEYGGTAKSIKAENGSS